MVDYYSFDNEQFLEENIKKYGTIYGYYDMQIEEKMGELYEKKFNDLTREIKRFIDGNKTSITLNKEVIYDFLDITLYRNPSIVSAVNNESLTSRLVGGFTHSFILDRLMTEKFPHVFDDLELNLIVNHTTKSFIVNKSMFSTVKVDNNNEIIIFPINRFVCIVLMEKEYYKKWCVNGNLHYMNVSKESDIDKINRYILVTAKNNNEDIIGDKDILKALILNDKNEGGNKDE